MFKQLKLVAGQVYRSKIKTPSFWVTVLSPLLFPVVILILSFIIGKTTSDSPANLAIVDNPVLVQTLKSGKLLDAKLSEVADVETAKKKIIDGKIDGYLVKSDDKYTLVTSTDGTTKFNETTVKTVLSQIDLAEKAAQLNLSAEDLVILQTPADLTMKTLSAKGESSGGDSKNWANYMISVIVSVFIFILLMAYTQMVAQEISNEKSSRIMETLLAATSAKVQYYGKILGVTLLVLTHILFYIVLGLVASLVLKGNETVKSVLKMVNGVDLNFLVFAILMILVSIPAYLFLTAIIASLVNDQSQVQQAVSPIVYLSMIGYMSSVITSSIPNNIIARVLSYLPFISSTFMPSRLATEVSSYSDAYIALALQAVALVLVAKFGENIYAKNVLSYSDEKIFKQFIRNLRNK
ncbi:ABC transporter permease [Lactococcus hodotermopsidis]|uniref:ABC transporter permease n=1 Tax=Pseudolactococcus hodotermopsidis TaxID=2709157 RepID=A0A6A0BBC8_9LACT|nr:ABC transporter permease [Lactococcus hodotermopsidis]GFH41684.1 ABC transporter permease [Lactococcus hodotermopsidis]